MFYHFLFSTCFLVVGCDKELKFSALRKIQISHDDIHDHEDDCDCDRGVWRSHDDADGGSRVNLVRAKEESESFTESNSGTYDVRMYMSKSYIYIWKKLFSSSIPYSACLRGCVCDIIHDFLLTDGLNYERVFDERVKNACRILLSILFALFEYKTASATSSYFVWQQQHSCWIFMLRVFLTLGVHPDEHQYSEKGRELSLLSLPSHISLPHHMCVFVCVAHKDFSTVGIRLYTCTESC